MTLEILDESADLPRSKRLKAATHATHERLDKTIMAGEPFADRQRYGWFLEVQYRFHHEVDPFYRQAALQAMFPDLAGRHRLDLIRHDMADLGVPIPQPVPTPSEPRLDILSALGWIYVAEGSSLGAAFLLKEAAKLGLSEEFGARHLASAPEGRGKHWKTFRGALDAVELAEDDEIRVLAGAEAAFRRVRGLVKEVFG